MDWTWMVVNKILLLVGTDDKLAVLCQDSAEYLTFKSKMEAEVLTHFDFNAFIKHRLMFATRTLTFHKKTNKAHEPS